MQTESSAEGELSNGMLQTSGIIDHKLKKKNILEKNERYAVLVLILLIYHC